MIALSNETGRPLQPQAAGTVNRWKKSAPIHRSGTGRSHAVKVRNPAFLQYLRSHFADAADERLHATYCDERGDYLHDEMLVSGSSSVVATRARVLFGRALALGANGLLLAHNHPSGCCRPSSNDLFATNRMRDIAAALDIILLDHLILTHEEIYSMRIGAYL